MVFGIKKFKTNIYGSYTDIDPVLPTIHKKIFGKGFFKKEVDDGKES